MKLGVSDSRSLIYNVITHTPTQPLLITTKLNYGVEGLAGTTNDPIFLSQNCYETKSGDLCYQNRTLTGSLNFRSVSITNQ